MPLVDQVSFLGLSVKVLLREAGTSISALPSPQWGGITVTAGGPTGKQTLGKNKGGDPCLGHEKKLGLAPACFLVFPGLPPWDWESYLVNVPSSEAFGLGLSLATWNLYRFPEPLSVHVHTCPSPNKGMHISFHILLILTL